MFKLWKSLWHELSLKEHNAEVHEEKICSKCDVLFGSRSILKRHLLEVHENTDTVHEDKKVYKCRFCDKVSKSKMKMKRHRISANHEGKKRYKCSICFSDFDKKVSLKHYNVAAHEKKVH